MAKSGPKEQTWTTAERFVLFAVNEWIVNGFRQLVDKFRDALDWYTEALLDRRRDYQEPKRMMRIMRVNQRSWLRWKWGAQRECEGSWRVSDRWRKKALEERAGRWAAKYFLWQITWGWWVVLGVSGGNKWTGFQVRCVRRFRTVNIAATTIWERTVGAWHSPHILFPDKRSGKDCSNGGTPSRARGRSQLSISTWGFKTQKQKHDKKQIIRQSTAPQEKRLRRQVKVNRAEFKQTRIF